MHVVVYVLSSSTEIRNVSLTEHSQETSHKKLNINLLFFTRVNIKIDRLLVVRGDDVDSWKYEKEMDRDTSYDEQNSVLCLFHSVETPLSLSFLSFK